MTSRTFIGVGLSALLIACGGNTPPAEEKTPDLVIGGESAGPTAALYQMPTPNELFTLVREMAGEGQKRMMNPAGNADRYVTMERRAANFGIYSTDLVYSSYFKLQAEVVRYYLTVKKLGDQLGLSSAFPEKDKLRLETNLAHGDSLEVISNEAYFRAYQKLQDEEMGPTLALVLAGGWVESMHLIMRQITRFDPNDPLVMRVADQKVSLEHLLDMMGDLGEDPNVTPIRDQLLGIRNIYDQLNVKRVVHDGATGSGRMVLGEDAVIELSAEKYIALEKAVEDLRAYMIAPEDGTGDNKNP